MKLLLLLRRFQGNMQSPTIAAMYPPLRMFYRDSGGKVMQESLESWCSYYETREEGREVAPRADWICRNVCPTQKYEAMYRPEWDI